MKKNELLTKLSYALELEETEILLELIEANQRVMESKHSANKKKAMKKLLDHLGRETLEHVKMLGNLIQEVVKSNAKEF